jgi:uncharacterized membrane protein HdeD (DUF308 family)
MIFPVGTSVFLIILIEMALLIDGISRLVHGFGDKVTVDGQKDLVLVQAFR